MSSDFKAFVYGWGILIAFLVIRYLVRKKNSSSLSNQTRVIDKIKSSRSLVFKGSREAFEYIQKFIETLPLQKGSAYYGVLGTNASMAQIHCKFKGKVETMMVSIREKYICDVRSITCFGSKFRLRISTIGVKTPWCHDHDKV